MAETYDFVIVGAGTSGLLLAYRLAHDLPTKSILVLETGPSSSDNSHMCQYNRFQAFLNPALDHGYMAAPQRSLNDRAFPYPRGKGPGGSSLTNFLGYVYGSAEDYNLWADMVGDESWKWQNTQRRFKDIENYRSDVPEGLKAYVNPAAKDHGQSGPLDISLPTHLEQGVAELYDVAVEYGMKPNPDLNSGNPSGVGLTPMTSLNGHRSTSESILKGNMPKNLTITTEAKATKVLIENKKAVGVQLKGGRKFLAKNEVILSAGTIDTPKLLLLSGIGSTDELRTHGIETVQDLPGVGKDLHDHILISIGAKFTPDIGLTERLRFDANQTAIKSAMETWTKDGTGPTSLHNSNLLTAWLKAPGIEQTPEFNALDDNFKTYLRHDSVPTYELILTGPTMPPMHTVPEDESYVTLTVCGMNLQSAGSVTLKSADPDDDPLLDPNYLSHPYDRRVMLEATREAMKFVTTAPKLKEHFRGYVLAPEGEGEEDLTKFIRETLGPVFHANGSVKMGRKEDPSACVDPRFRVYGVQNLRVADLSVCPLTPNNHTQSTAYLVGQAAAEVLVEEYKYKVGSGVLRN